MEFQYEKRFWVVFTCIPDRVSSKNEPDDFCPTFSTKNIHTHTKCTQLSEKHHHAHKNCHNSGRPIQHLRKFVYWIYFRLSPVCQWISFYSTRIFYFSYQVYFFFSCTPQSLSVHADDAVWFGRYIHKYTHTEQMKEEQKKNCAPFRRNSFCYLLFSNNQTTLSSFEFSTITWIKTTKEKHGERFWNAKFILFPFFWK